MSIATPAESAASPNPLRPILPPDSRHSLHWGQLHGANPALLIAAAAVRYRGLVLAMVPDSQTAARLETELRVVFAQRPPPPTSFGFGHPSQSEIAL